MIKAKLSVKGNPIIVLGLSHENLRRLKDRKPIQFDLADLGIQPSVPVMIFSGKDERAMQAELSEYFDLPKGDGNATDNG